MSAFIVSNETMHQAVALIVGKRWGGYRFQSFADVAIAGVYSERKVATEIGRKLFAMNARAVGERYDESPDASPAFAYSYKHSDAGTIARYKSLGCLLYQCAEGSVIESKLYKELESAYDAMAHEIVSGLPEYDKAAWDVAS